MFDRYSHHCSWIGIVSEIISTNHMSSMWPSDFMLFFGRNVWFDLMNQPASNHDALGMNMVARSVICLLEGLFYGTRNSADDIMSCFPTFPLTCFFLTDAFSMWLFHTMIQLSTYLWNRLSNCFTDKHWYKLFCFFSFWGDTLGWTPFNVKPPKSCLARSHQRP